MALERQDPLDASTCAGDEEGDLDSTRMALSILPAHLGVERSSDNPKGTQLPRF